MSQINHKKPGFSPLNTRKPNNTVGQTYGERREKVKAKEAEGELSWLERAKDRFLGGKKTRDIRGFANSADRFSGAHRSHFSSNPIVEQKTRLEEGLTLSSRAVPPSKDQYVRFLDSVIHYLDVKKPSKKV